MSRGLILKQPPPTLKCYSWADSQKMVVGSRVLLRSQKRPWLLMQAVGHAKIVLYRAALASNRQVVVLIDDRREENENKYAFHSSEKSNKVSLICY